jgi:hypothetical protein
MMPYYFTEALAERKDELRAELEKALKSISR